jgi:hypothetical protein
MSAAHTAGDKYRLVEDDDCLYVKDSDGGPSYLVAINPDEKDWHIARKICQKLNEDDTPNIPDYVYWKFRAYGTPASEDDVSRAMLEIKRGLGYRLRRWLRGW